MAGLYVPFLAVPEAVPESARAAAAAAARGEEGVEVLKAALEAAAVSRLPAALSWPPPGHPATPPPALSTWPRVQRLVSPIDVGAADPAAPQEHVAAEMGGPAAAPVRQPEPEFSTPIPRNLN